MPCSLSQSPLRACAVSFWLVVERAPAKSTTVHGIIDNTRRRQLDGRAYGVAVGRVGALPVERDADRRRADVSASRNNEVVRLAHGDAGRRASRAAVTDGHRRSARTDRWGTAARRALHAARRVRPVGRNGRRVFSVPLSEGLLAHRQRGAARGALLFSLVIHLRGGCRAVEHRRAAPPIGMSERRLFTVGHSTRTIEEFTGILDEAGVTRIVDVRYFP